MEKMTLGCYGGVVNSWGCNWVGLVHNNDPPAEKTTALEIHIPSAVYTTQLWQNHN